MQVFLARSSEIFAFSFSFKGEINNTDVQNNGLINSKKPNPQGTNIYVPTVKEITIKRPVAEGKERPKPVDQPKSMEFIF